MKVNLDKNNTTTYLRKSDEIPNLAESSPTLKHTMIMLKPQMKSERYCCRQGFLTKMTIPRYSKIPIQLLVELHPPIDCVDVAEAHQLLLRHIDVVDR